LENICHKELHKIESALRSCMDRAVPWAGEVFRSAAPKYAGTRDMTTGLGSARAGGRWNPAGSFPTVYASLEPETAMSESLATFRYYGWALHSALPRLFRAIHAELASVLDLRELPPRHPLHGWMDRALEEDWRAFQSHGCESTSQAIGHAAHTAGLEGLLVPSHVSPGGGNLVAFPDRLRPGSRIQAF
jgi:RES domain-containing protein